MDREILLTAVKIIIEKYIDDARCGIFDCVGWLDDPTQTLYRKYGVIVRICWDYGYFEVLGLTDEEFTEVERYYNNLNAVYYD